MARVLMLVSAQGALLAETRVNEEGPEADAIAEAQLRDEALVCGFTEDEVGSARLSTAGDPPLQP